MSIPFSLKRISSNENPPDPTDLNYRSVKVNFVICARKNRVFYRNRLHQCFPSDLHREIMHGYYRERVKSWLHSMLDTSEGQQEGPVGEGTVVPDGADPVKEEKRSETGFLYYRLDIEKERTKNTELQRPVQEYMECLKDESTLMAVHPELDRLEKALLDALEPYCVTYDSELCVMDSVTLPCGSRIFIRPILPIDKLAMKECTGKVRL